MLIACSDEIKEVDLAPPLYESAGELLGGSMEHIVARRLERPYCMIVNGESSMLGLPENKVGCYLYETDEHGYPILGDIIIMKDVWTSEGVDIAGLEDDDIASVTGILEEVVLEVDAF